MMLFTGYRSRDLELPNRLVMAPMTRCRAIGNLANQLMATYYRQRAGAGLIVTEGTSPSPNGLGYARIPGLFNEQQAESWQQVTDAVHAAGGRIFVQLMHTGRVSHLANMPEGARVLAPSAVPFLGEMWTDATGSQPCTPPQAMTLADVQTAIAEFVQAAQLARQAGFDGVELHAANGYLIDQFLNANTNQRSDAYGAGNTGRNRFALEIARGVAEAIGAGRTGIRLSPHGVFNDMAGFDSLPQQYAELAAELGKLKLAYLHLVDQSALGCPPPKGETVEGIRTAFRENGGGAIILSGGFDRERAEAALASGAAELIAFGRPYIANPDLERRLQQGAKLNAWDEASFYSADEKGYTDYPSL